MFPFLFLITITIFLGQWRTQEGKEESEDALESLDYPDESVETLKSIAQPVENYARIEPDAKDRKEDKTIKRR